MNTTRLPNPSNPFGSVFSLPPANSSLSRAAGVEIIFPFRPCPSLRIRFAAALSRRTPLASFRKQQRDDEPHPPGGRAIRPYSVIFAEDSDAEWLRADFEDLADARDDRHGPRLRRPVVGGFRLQVQRGVAWKCVRDEGIEESRAEDGRPPWRNRDRAPVIAKDGAAAEPVLTR